MSLNRISKLGILDLIVLVLSIYVLGALLVDTFFVLPPEISILLNYIDYSICIIFFIDFFSIFITCYIAMNIPVLIEFSIN